MDSGMDGCRGLLGVWHLFAADDNAGSLHGGTMASTMDLAWSITPRRDLGQNSAFRHSVDRTLRVPVRPKMRIALGNRGFAGPLQGLFQPDEGPKKGHSVVILRIDFENMFARIPRT